MEDNRMMSCRDELVYIYHYTALGECIRLNASCLCENMPGAAHVCSRVTQNFSSLKRCGCSFFYYYLVSSEFSGHKISEFKKKI